MTLWSIKHERLKTNDFLYHAGLLESPVCPVFGTARDTIKHVLRECIVAWNIWPRLKPEGVNLGSPHLPLQQWLAENLKLCSQNKYWSCAFPEAIYGIWLWRNKIAHNPGKFVISHIPNLISTHVREAVEMNRALKALKRRKEVAIAWQPPGVGCWKLNVDASRREENECSAIGGIVRNSLGNWQGGFMLMIGECDILEAELLGILHASMFLLSRPHPEVTIETDSSVALELISSSSEAAPLFHIIKRIRCNLGNLPTVSLHHIWREGNKSADKMAKQALNLQLSQLQILTQPPPWLLEQLIQDASGVLDWREVPD